MHAAAVAAFSFATYHVIYFIKNIVYVLSLLLKKSLDSSLVLSCILADDLLSLIAATILFISVTTPAINEDQVI